MNEFNFDRMKGKRIPQVERKLDWLMEEILKDKSDMVDFLAEFTAKYMNVFKEREEYQDALRHYKGILNRLMEAHRVRDYRDCGVGIHH